MGRGGRREGMAKSSPVGTAAGARQHHPSTTRGHCQGCTKAGYLPDYQNLELGRNFDL